MPDDMRDLQDFKDVLLRTDESFRQLVAEHHDLDARVQEFSTTHHLTPQQQYEEAFLKKRKLALKDRIEATLRERRAGAAALPH